VAPRKRRGRPVDGILLLNKPKGITSNKILQKLKHHYHAAKAGHTGSLDPLATGMLPICFGEATKFSQYLLDADKTYRVTARMGIKTDTSDAEGEVIETREVHVTEAQLLQTLEHFRGDIEQVPSMYSALKVDGQPLYKLAREGKTIARAARPVTIYQLDCLSFSDTEFSLEVRCSKGTYIRNLVEDIGEQLGCGAHVTVLERLTVAGFPAGQWHDWDCIEQLTDYAELDALLLPVDTAILHFPAIELADDEADFIRHGQAVNHPDIPDQGLVRLYDKKEQFIGLGQINEDGMLAPKRLIAQSQ
jgi:tRNA pseudouridine55 synthase